MSVRVIHVPCHPCYWNLDLPLLIQSFCVVRNMSRFFSDLNFKIDLKELLHCFPPNTNCELITRMPHILVLIDSEIKQLLSQVHFDTF